MAQRVLLFIWTVVLCALLVQSTPIKFTVKPDEELCFTEFVSKGAAITGEWKALPDGARVSVNVFEAENKLIYSKQKELEGKFGHTAMMDGEYRMCFLSNDGVNQIKTVDIDINTGVHLQEVAEFAKRSNLEPMEIELKKIDNLIDTIQEDLKFLESREQQMRSTNESSSRRLLFLTGVCLIVSVGLSFAQVFFMRQFFRKKRYID